MVTLSNALQLPILEQARVVAGVQGLDSPVRWVHVMGVPNAADWLHGGELLLTTFLNMPDAPAEQSDYLRQLAAKRIAGIVITTGMRLQEIPDYLRAIGDELALPIIDLPYQIRFVDIAKAINETQSQKKASDTVRPRPLHPAALEPARAGRRRILRPG